MQRNSRPLGRFLLTVSAAVVLLSARPAPAQVLTDAQGRVVDAQGRTRLLVTFRDRPNPALIERFGGRVHRVFRLAPIVSCSIREANAELLWRLAGVEFVEPERVVQALYTAGEVVPWGIARIHAPKAYDGGFNGSGAIVAVLDTGIDLSHPDLAMRYLGGYDFVDGDDAPEDENGHGTHVAGTIAASDNGSGVVGAAPGVGLHAVKFLDALGLATTSDEIQAVQWASQRGPDVINMSFGSYRSSWAERRALRQASRRGALLVAAGGNDGDDTNNYPAAYPFVVGVGATDAADQRAYFSNTNNSIELAAPGLDVYSTMPTYDVMLTLLGYDYGHDYLSGTSSAAPHVSGAAALVFAARPGWGPSQVRQRLNDTALDLGAPGRDTWFGYGLVDAAAAVGAGGGSTPGGDFGTIQGTVTQNGRPSGWKLVSLLNEVGTPIATTRSNWQGSYSFADVPADLDPATFYQAQVSWWLRTVTSDPVDLQPGQVATVDLAL